MSQYRAYSCFLYSSDEVIFLEPFFDQYEMEVKYNDGIPVYVPLIPPPPATSGKNVGADQWKIDFDLLRSKLESAKVKAIILNTPHNPVGKVFTLEELQELATLCIKHDLLVLSDEVYDCLTFDGKKHIRIASLEGMWERTITVGSAGKSFACTGWRVGWLIGPERLIKPTLVAHTRILFAINSAASEAGESM
jgi:kynurenine aminotransferase